MANKKSKRFFAIRDGLNGQDRLDVEAAVETVKAKATAKFDEGVDVAVRLGVDPKHADQMVRGAVALPHGTGKDVRVVVFAQGEAAKAAQDAGADEVGGDDLVAKIQGGWFEFDKAVATTDMMGKVGRIGRVLGPRGLMPNPRSERSFLQPRLRRQSVNSRAVRSTSASRRPVSSTLRLVGRRWIPTNLQTTSQRWLRPCSGSSQPLPRVCT